MAKTTKKQTLDHQAISVQASAEARLKVVSTPERYNPEAPKLTREAQIAVKRIAQSLSPETLVELQSGTPSPAMDHFSAAVNAQARADAFVQPEFQAAAVQIEFGSSVMPGMEFDRLRATLKEANERIALGDVRDVEAMLYSQASALNAVFTSLVRRAVEQDHLPRYQTYLTLALKAQAQSRSTLEALAYVKNPPSATFVRQQNVAANQQVNNHSQARSESKAFTSNELLEGNSGHQERLEQRTPPAARGQDRPVEAMGAIDGPKNE